MTGQKRTVATLRICSPNTVRVTKPATVRIEELKAQLVTMQRQAFKLLIALY